MKEVREKTKRIATNIQDALKWADRQDDEVKKSSLNNLLKSLDRSIYNINNAIQKRPSIAIFGQSQVGKSYLVQNLAKSDNEKYLKINGGSKNANINFLTDMNPAGGQESTGLVTRFTTEKQTNNDDFPFKVELFSQLDIAAILINSFWSDLKDYDINLDKEEYELIVGKLDTLSNNTPTNDINEFDVYYFVDYILNNFSDAFIIRDLKKVNYFKFLQEKLHLIENEDRWEVLSILWGKNQFLTEIFEKISLVITELEHQAKVEVSIEALSPNTSTILDVERVREIFDLELKASDVSVLLQSNKKVKVNRSIFSVLTKEVCLELVNSFQTDENRSFMNKSDLLDFPGSKSREKIPLKVFNSNSLKQKLQLLIRGKVSYLFDTYTNHLGVDTLLYCMDDNPPEEKEAPARLYNWVKKYIGENSEERTEKISKTKDILRNEDSSVNEVSPLLVVLTKFNQEINKVLPGAETDIQTHNSKWVARINENFVNFMSRPVEDKWVLNWTEDQEKFNFIFPIRDPMYSQATFEGYETENKETKIRPERKEAMNSIGISFHSSQTTRDHIIDAKEVWNELSTPNGSGINYLSKYLKNSSNPIVARTRLNIELNKINRDLESILKPYLISGNINEDLKKAKANANIAFTSLIALANRQDNMLSKIMSKMIVSDIEIWNIIYENTFEYKSVEEKVDSTENNINVIQSFSDLGITIEEDTTKEDVISHLNIIYDGLSYDEIKNIIKDFINFDIEHLDNLLSKKESNSPNKLADAILKYWVNKVNNVTMDASIANKLSDRYVDALRDLVNQILKSRQRLDVKNRIIGLINEIESGSINQEDIDLVASSCATTLNNFLFSAGWSFEDEDKKPVINTKPIFSNHANQYNLDELSYKQSSNKKAFLKEWSQGCKSVFEENVKFDYGVMGNLNTANNEALTKIIERLNN